jgi:hypothetical protein
MSRHQPHLSKRHAAYDVAPKKVVAPDWSLSEMPMFHFNLKADNATYVDPDGTDLRDELEALDHARQVARELMRCQELRTRSWRLQICDAERRPCVELPFAGMDPVTSQVLPFPRSSGEADCRQRGVDAVATGAQRVTR